MLKARTAAAIVWSPDRRFIGFVSLGRLRQIEVVPWAGADAVRLASRMSRRWWSSNGVIIFGMVASGLMQVSETDGTLAPVTTVDASHDFAEAYG